MLRALSILGLAMMLGACASETEGDDVEETPTVSPALMQQVLDNPAYEVASNKVLDNPAYEVAVANKVLDNPAYE